MADDRAAPIRRLERRRIYTNQWDTLFEDATEVSGRRGVYSVVSRADAVVVVLTSHDHNVLMVHSFRYPTGQFSLELPMGAVDPGESPSAAAIRELREETGVAVDGGPTQVGWFFALPGLTDQRVYVYAVTAPAAVLRSARTSESEADLTGAVLVSIGDVPRLVATGEITDSLTLCGLSLSGIPLHTGT